MNAAQIASSLNVRIEDGQSVVLTIANGRGGMRTIYVDGARADGTKVVIYDAEGNSPMVAEATDVWAAYRHY
jgi:hypothetical protein